MVLSRNKKQRIVIHAEAELEDLIPGYLKNQRNDAGRIRKLLVSGDFEGIRRIGHSMKGSGGGYGFDEITAIGARIEEAAKGGDDTAIRDLTDTLLEYLDGVEVVYDW